MAPTADTHTAQVVRFPARADFDPELTKRDLARMWRCSTKTIERYVNPASARPRGLSSLPSLRAPLGRRRFRLSEVAGGERKEERADGDRRARRSLLREGPPRPRALRARRDLPLGRARGEARSATSRRTRRGCCARARRNRKSIETCDEFAARWPDDYPIVKHGPTRGQRKSDKTLRGYRDELKPFVREFRGIKLADVDRPMARKYANERPRSAVVVRNMFSDAVDDGLIDANPFANLQLEQARGRSQHTTITEEEFRGQARHPVPRAHSGPGRLLDESTGTEQPGSPLRALSVRKPFTHYVFSDFSQECVAALSARVGTRADVEIVRGDANDPDHLERVAGLLNVRALVIAYLDPAHAQDLRWTRSSTSRRGSSTST